MMDMATSPLPALSSSAPAAWIPRPATIGRDALYLCAGLPAGIVTFSVLVTGLSLAAGLAITLVGIPVMLATLYASRLMGDAERWRAGWVLDAPVTRTARPWRGGIWERTKVAFTDVGAWRDMVWGAGPAAAGNLRLHGRRHGLEHRARPAHLAVLVLGAP
jgi:hypothetical protein